MNDNRPNDELLSGSIDRQARERRDAEIAEWRDRRERSRWRRILGR